MLDAFAALQVPRRPLLPEADVRAAFQRRAAEAHPDVAADGSPDFAALTEAYETLRRPATRLRHLLELEGAGGSPAGFPTALADFFPRIAEVLQKAESFRNRRAKASGSVARALFAQEQVEVCRLIKSAAETLNAERAAAMEELAAADAAWPGDISALPGLQSRFAYLDKWSDQLRESLLRLEIE